MTLTSKKQTGSNSIFRDLKQMLLMHSINKNKTEGLQDRTGVLQAKRKFNMDRYGKVTGCSSKLIKKIIY